MIPEHRHRRRRLARAKGKPVYHAESTGGRERKRKEEDVEGSGKSAHAHVPKTQTLPGTCTSKIKDKKMYCKNICTQQNDEQQNNIPVYQRCKNAK